MKLSTMMAAVGAATVALACAAGAFAQDVDPHAELLEWVFEPCMEVSAAFGVKDYEQDQIEMGVKREHIALLMLASRDSAIRDVATKMKAGTTWEARRTAYPVLLRLCLAQLPGMK